jgi:hypothetical protein
VLMFCFLHQQPEVPDLAVGIKGKSLMCQILTV